MRLLAEQLRLHSSTPDTAASGERVLPYVPHPGQALLHTSSARFKVVACGRRWGKDRWGIQEVLQKAYAVLNDPDRSLNLVPAFEAWFIYPTIPSARQLWEELKVAVPQSWLIKAPNNSEHLLELRGVKNRHGVIRVRSSTVPKDLVAAGLDILVFGEAARQPVEAWRNIRPALDSPERLGLAILSSVPMGRNWFYNEFRRGQSEEATEWESWNFPTAFEIQKDGSLTRHRFGNPYITEERFTAVMEEWRETPKWFNQEYMAEFISAEGSAFENVRACISPPPQQPVQPIVIGVDLGRRKDATVFSVLDGMKRQIAIERLVQQPYRAQLRHLRELIAQHQARLVVVESNGPGDPFIEELCHTLMFPTREVKDFAQWKYSSAACEVMPFYTTYASKRSLIEELALSFEQGSDEITILNDPIQVNEMELFEYVLLESGRVKYAGPEDIHDDCVMALALAHWPLSQNPRHTVELATVPDVESKEYKSFETPNYWSQY